MFANVSFGILAFSPLGWALMAVVVVLEAVALRAFLTAGHAPRNRLVVSLVANAVSGIAGFVISLVIDGGWWLVIWVPWVTASESSSEQWPRLAAYMGVAFAGSFVLETVVVRALVANASARRVALVVGGANLVSSICLLGVFWAMGGVPGG